MRPIDADKASRGRLRIHGVTRESERQKRKPRAHCVAIWASIISNEIHLGSRFLVTVPDGNLYMVIGVNGEIVPLPRAGRGGDRFFAYLNLFYGIAEREDLSRFVYDCIRAHGLVHGTHVELRRFSAYDAKSKICYLSTYDGHMWRLDGSSDPRKIQNGESDVFFIDDDAGHPVKGDITIAKHGVLFDAVTDLNFTSGLNGITPEQQRRAMIIWMFCLALPDLMPTKPLLMLEGTQGSGKSSATQLLQTALMGDVKPLILSKSKEDAFGILLLRSPIAVFDNTDSYIDWVADAICAYTTTGIFPRRKLYSDDEEIIIKPHAFIAVASKNPASFRREDVVDRSLILRLERRESFTPFRKLKERVVQERQKILGEYLWYVNQIVAEVRAGALDIEINETHRMADFAAIGRVVAKICEWPEGSLEALMTALQAERDAFVNEEDPLVRLLHTWIGHKYRTGQSNVGREVDSVTLYQELETLAQAAGIEKAFHSSPRALAQKIRSPHILRDFDLELGTTGGQKTYKLWRKTDVRLGVIPGGDTLLHG